MRHKGTKGVKIVTGLRNRVGIAMLHVQEGIQIHVLLENFFVESSYTFSCQ